MGLDRRACVRANVIGAVTRVDLGAHWDKNSGDADVIRKIDAAQHWARSVRDDGQYGDWHYVFATETHIKRAGSWTALKVATNPE